MKSKIFLSLIIAGFALLFTSGTANAGCSGHKVVCMTDNFGYIWEISYCHAFHQASAYIYGTADLGTGTNWGFNGLYTKLTKEISWVAYNPNPDACATMPDSIIYTGHRQGSHYFGTWTNTCGGNGSFNGTSFIGSCGFLRPIINPVVKNPIGNYGTAAKYELPSGSDDAAMDAYLDAEFSLHPSSPNPFSDVTSINYDLFDDGSTVTITIYNAIGQLVSTLYNGTQESGDHNLTWDGTDVNGRKLAGGSYFCKVNINDNSETQMITIIR